METLEVKPPSWRARLWARLSDLDKRPRRWWFPPSSRRDEVRRIPDAARQDYQKSVQQAHEKFSETVRLTMLSLLAFALFCLLITFSTPDSGLLVADPTIKTPFADVQVSFQSFLILAPFLLIVVTLYLHIFYGYWLDLEMDYQHLTLSRKLSEPSIEHLPTLFSLDHPVPRLLTAFIFYWLVPFVLLVMTWKAAARLEWGAPLVFLTGIVTVILVFLQIRRCPASQRKWNRFLWGGMGVIVACMAAITVLFMAQLPRHKEMVVVLQWLPRPLNIVRADLKGKWLAEVNLRNAYANVVNLQGANLQGANLQGANLQGANLQKANLQGANLQGANLQGANLQKADLQKADLQGANLQGTNLQKADLQGANLQEVDLQKANLQHAYLQRATLMIIDLRDANLWGANLQGATLLAADLRGADLREVKGLTEEQLQSVRIDEKTQFSPYLKTPRPAEPDEATLPPEGTTPME